MFQLHCNSIPQNSKSKCAASIRRGSLALKLFYNSKIHSHILSFQNTIQLTTTIT